MSFARNSHLTTLEIIMFVVGVFAVFGFIMPFLISARDTLLVACGLLVGALMLWWGTSICRRVVQSMQIED